MLILVVMIIVALLITCFSKNKSREYKPISSYYYSGMGERQEL